ncbi:MAG: alkylhydroperoxidase [Deltaproteobacteria bacterium HGW-Deltaproteobacteria-12]|jgi:AhpD family alkylhydroperoxidase|nr:MAG: alkylhydroperoxidase [Deltaproteobacteria bacterium HGW-Deltaproteobacteria-12]
MSDHFYTKDGLKSIGKLMELKPDLFGAFFAFDQKVFAAGALSVKVKELIAVGAAHITRCPYCIDGHVKRAKKAGATDEELAEAIFVGIAMSAGAAAAHSCIATDAM